MNAVLYPSPKVLNISRDMLVWAIEKEKLGA